MSTVNINVGDITGSPQACEVLFIPLSTPRVDGGTMLTLSGSRSVVIGASGIGSIILEPGSYSVRFLGIPKNLDAIEIVVPGDELSYYLTALISAGVACQPQPLFNLMGFAIDVDGDLVPSPDLIPGGQFALDADDDLVPV